MIGRVVVLACLVCLLAVESMAGLCRTGFGSPGQKTETKSWEAIFARPQPDMKNNPKKATYGADWQKTLKAYPWLKKTARSVIKDLEKRKFKMTKKFNFRMPFTRVCVPTEYGIKNDGLKPTDMVIRVNPNGYKTDSTSKLFYKAMIRNGKIFKGYAGRTGH